jgi:DNA-binding NtrC family response regulator
MRLELDRIKFTFVHKGRRVERQRNIILRMVLIPEFGSIAMTKFVTLVVEDDVLQRTIVADLLKDDGFEVLECATAEAAELIVAASGAELQALVTDQNLAGRMTGAELAQFASQRHPALNVIVMSGDAAPDLPTNTRFMHKPFEPMRLLDAVRR